MLHKEVRLEIKLASDDGLVEGYGSTFNGQPDAYGDVVLPGAFAESIAQHKQAGTMPLMLWGHQAGELPIGDWTDVDEDAKGLRLKGQVDTNDPVGQRVHQAMKRKRVRGLSIGYETVKSRTDENRPGVRLLEKLNLWEVSPVNFPADRRASIVSVKGVEPLRDRLAAGDRLTEREFELLFKQAFDLSNNEAERAVRINLKGQGEPGGTANDELKQFLSALHG